MTSSSKVCEKSSSARATARSRPRGRSRRGRRALEGSVIPAPQYTLKVRPSSVFADSCAAEEDPGSLAASGAHPVAKAPSVNAHAAAVTIFRAERREMTRADLRPSS